MAMGKLEIVLLVKELSLNPLFCRSMYMDEDGHLAHEFYEETADGSLVLVDPALLTPQVYFANTHLCTRSHIYC